MIPNYQSWPSDAEPASGPTASSDIGVVQTKAEVLEDISDSEIAALLKNAERRLRDE